MPFWPPALRSARRCFIGVLMVCLLGGVGRAQGPGHFPLKSYGFQDGLKNLTVLALAQDAQGHIWAGTESGLYRFDGRRFEGLRFGEESLLYVTSLQAEPGGRLWVGTRNGLGWVENGSPRFHRPAEVQGDRIHTLGMDAQGGLWVLMGNRLLHRPGSEAPFTPVTGGPTEAGITDCFADPGLTEIWATTSDRLWVLREGSWREVPGPVRQRNEGLIGVAVDAEDTVWVRSSANLYQRRRGEAQWRPLPVAYGGALPDNFQMRRDREGWVWITTLSRLIRCRGAEVRPMGGGPRAYVPVTGLVDREGSPWYAAIGVTRILGRGLWELHTVEEGLPNNVVWHALRDRQGRLWLATDGGLVLGTPTGWRTVRPGQFSRLRLHPDGSILAVGSPGGMVYRIDPRTFAVETLRVDAMPLSPSSRGLAVEPDGTVWVSDYRNGAAQGRRENGRWTWTKATLEGREIQGVFQVIQNADGSIFLLTRSQAYLRIPGGWVALDADGNHNPFAAARMPDGDVWVTYLDQPLLTRHRQGPHGWVREETWWPKPDRPDLVIFAEHATPDGRLWIGTSQGLGLLDPARRTLEAWYLPGDGIPGADACNQGIVQEPNGDLWYGTTEGVGRFRAAQEPKLPLPPPPTLLQAVGAEAPGADGRHRFPAGHPVELHVACNAFVASEETALEVRTDPGSPWQRFEDTRIRLGMLPAGRYELEIRAVRIGSQVGPSLHLPVEVRPHLWETWTFRLLGAGFLVALVALLVRLRSRALLRHNQELQAVVAARTEELARANEGLQQASRAKSLFLASMSHELRTPLNAILLYSELLAGSAEDRQDTESAQDVQKIRQAGQHLLAMINGILDLSKIEAGMMELDLEVTDLAALFAEVADTVRPLVEQRDNRLEVELPANLPPFRTDVTKLRQILINLLGNACKFTEAGRITLRAGTDGGGLHIDVVDTGLGMTGDQVARIFKAFEQADEGIQRRFGGTGLGLTISQRLVHLLQGRIEVRSVPGEGSTFSLHLPELVAPHSGPHPLLAPVVPSPQLTAGFSVLVIDDDLPTLEALARALEKLGLRVRTAAGGAEGLAAALAEPPDVVVLDIAMPGMDGWEVLTRLKSDPATTPVPVVLLTFAEDKARGLSMGAIDLLRKPIAPDHLAAILLRHGGRSRALRILAVDDDPIILEAVANSVARAGWECRQARSAAEAQTLLAEALPDVILLDLAMPGVDGFQFVDLLQQHPAWREIPVVVLTAQDLAAEDLQRLMVPQVQRVLRKGSQSLEGLLSLVQSLCAGSPPGGGGA